ncbi:MAG: cytochrome c biogenesis protein ResB [Bacteroidia bacterium]|nr:cytochrome c biogenesis protein ResB [Bacteroidia bacterium]
MNNSRKIWEKPWKYTEGFIVAAGIALAGLLLQFSLGNINPTDFGFPVNIIIGALFVVGLLCCHFLLKDNHVVRWLSSVRSTLPALLVMLLFIVIMGLTPQFTINEPQEHLPGTIFSRMGWYRMTTSWAFVLLCFYTLAILGFATLKKTRKPQSWRLLGFYLNHIGLFLALLGGLLGSGDMQRLTMNVVEGNVEWRAQDALGNVQELPVAIELDTFKIEEYLPKLVVIDNHSGRILPENRPESHMFEAVGQTMQIAGNNIEILDYIPDAAVVRDSAAVSVVPMMMEGAATALKVRVTNPLLAKPVEGWVSNGSYVFPYQVLYIDDATSVAMPVQEVKKYTSQVTVFTESGHTKKADIEVNKPLSINNWVIYQYSYDESLGKYSKTSVFELVRDPWLKVVYTGIYMLLAGALFLFIAGPKKS